MSNVHPTTALAADFAADFARAVATFTATAAIILKSPEYGILSDPHVSDLVGTILKSRPQLLTAVGGDDLESVVRNAIRVHRIDAEDHFTTPNPTPHQMARLMMAHSRGQDYRSKRATAECLDGDQRRRLAVRLRAEMREQGRENQLPKNVPPHLEGEHGREHKVVVSAASSKEE